jgi:hypothetical protein
LNLSEIIEVDENVFENMVFVVVRRSVISNVGIGIFAVA